MADIIEGKFGQTPAPEPADISQIPISKHEFVMGCMKPFMYWLEASFADGKMRTPQEWNEQYVQYCQTQLPDQG